MGYGGAGVYGGAYKPAAEVNEAANKKAQEKSRLEGEIKAKREAKVEVEREIATLSEETKQITKLKGEVSQLETNIRSMDRELGDKQRMLNMFTMQSMDLACSRYDREQQKFVDRVPYARSLTELKLLLQECHEKKDEVSAAQAKIDALKHSVEGKKREVQTVQERLTALQARGGATQLFAKRIELFRIDNDIRMLEMQLRYL
eukprot:GDKI01034680.1.p1 GENE.GDKI01034680.1~~GDKI01034680.1.p1  ORF type:complete len:203 (-),score=38.81 GDKI01034680.1:158-766(-)